MTSSHLSYDFLIIGQGICGTFLGYYLHKEGQRVMVIDEPRPSSASRVASGVINPVTGRRVVTVWMAETLLDFSLQAYREFGALLNETLINRRDIISFPPSQQMADTYLQRAAENNSYIKTAPGDLDLSDWFTFLFEAVEINPTYLVNLHPMLTGWRNKLVADSSLLEEVFDETQLNLHENGVQYKNISAKKIIYCNGTGAYDSIYWRNLPSVYNKGEALIVDIPGLPQQQIYKFGTNTLVPWYNGLWWVGSSYENEFENALPTARFKQQKERELAFILKQTFTIVDHLSSIRPATIERRPFVGLHPLHNNVAILNGMGTKGCSLAPYFAWQLSQQLVHGQPLMPEADVQRFRKILSAKSATKN